MKIIWMNLWQHKFYIKNMKKNMAEFMPAKILYKRYEKNMAEFMPA